MVGRAINLPVISTSRLRLEAIGAQHSGGMFQLWSDEEVCKYSGHAHDVHGKLIPLPARTAADSDRIIQFFEFRQKEGTGCRWAMTLRPSGRFIGALGFNALDEEYEIAWHLNPAHWGCGYMSEAVEAVMAWALAQGANVVNAYIEPGNTRSIRLAEKMGLRAQDVFDESARKYSRER
ncbi:MAG: GNAT family N-acetyltransferase [Pseudomonadota bacterium]